MHLRKYCFLLAFYIVVKVGYKWTGGSTVEVSIEDERFTVVCSRCLKTLTLEISGCCFADYVK